MSDYILVKTTFDLLIVAEDTAKDLINKHLAASVQLSKIQSFSVWGSQEYFDMHEYELSCITRKEKYAELEEYFKEQHILSVPVLNISEEYAKWVFYCLG